MQSSPTVPLLLALLLVLLLVAANSFSAAPAHTETFAASSGLPPCNKVLSADSHNTPADSGAATTTAAAACQNEWDTPTFFEQTVTVPTANSFAFYDPLTGAQSTIDGAIRTASKKSLDACVGNAGIIADVGVALYPMVQTTRKSTSQLANLQRLGRARSQSHKRLDAFRALVASVE
jgi:hypothetical protein